MTNATRLLQSLALLLPLLLLLQPNSPESTLPAIQSLKNTVTAFLNRPIQAVQTLYSTPGTKIIACTLIYDSRLDDPYVHGYMYSATVTGEACGRGSPREMVMRAVEECAAEMRAEGAKRGCCRTRLDGGWGCMVQVAGDREGIMRDRGC